MKYILSILLFFSLAVKGQDTTKYTPMAAKGYKFNGATFKNIWIGQDTTNYKTGIVRIGFRFFVGNGVYWKEIAGGSSAPSGLSGAVVTQIDSTRFNVSPGSYYIQGSLYANGDTTFNLDTPGDTSRIDVIGLDTTGNVFTITGVESENPYPSSIDPLSQIYLSFVWVDTDTVYFAPTPVNYWSALGNDIINNNSGKVRFTNGLSMDQITANDSRLFSGAKQLVLQSNKTTGVRILTGRVGGNVDLNTTELQLSLGDNSTTGTAKNGLSLTGRSLHASGTEAMNMISITPSLVQSGTYTGTVRGIYYNPTVTANLGTHYAFESTLGSIKFGGMETGDTTTYKPLGIDASGNLRQLASWPAGGGGGVGTLQQVTDLGNTTTRDITVADIDADSARVQYVISDLVNSGTVTTTDITILTGDVILPSPILNLSSPGAIARLNFSSVSGDKTFYLPNQEGTIALIENLTDSLQVLRDSLAAYRAEDTVFTTSGIETVYGDDSTTIRLPYKSYVAIVDIDGSTADPTVTVLQNDLGGTPVWTRIGAGVYWCTLTGAFTANKTVMPNMSLADDVSSLSSGFHILADQGATIRGIGKFYKTSDDEIKLITLDTTNGGAEDMGLNKFTVEIRVYY